MTITALAAGGTASSGSSGTTMAGTASPANVGDQVVAILVTDNFPAVDGNSNEHLTMSVTSGHTWTKLYEWTNSNGSAGAGITVSVWLLNVTVDGMAGTMAITFANAIVDKTWSMYEFSSTKPLAVDVAPVGNDTDASNDFGSVNSSGLPSKERLWIRALGKEVNSTVDITPSTGFTVFPLQRSRNNAAAVCVRGEFRINTSTGETSNPAMAVAGDTAGIWLALAEPTQAPRSQHQYRMRHRA